MINKSIIYSLYYLTWSLNINFACNETAFIKICKKNLTIENCMVDEVDKT